jgi:ABC-type nickel/cobalt efflux system permease component RcnA
MPKVALYTAATVFTAIAVFLAALYVFDTDVILGNTLYRPLNLVAAAILFMLLAAWMIVASLEFRGAELIVTKERRA